MTDAYRAKLESYTASMLQAKRMLTMGILTPEDYTKITAWLREDVPELTKKLIESAVKKEAGLHKEAYNGSTKHGAYSLYCL